MTEIWKPVPSYEGYYEASTTGKVRSVERIVILKDKLGNDRPCKYKSRELKPCKREFKNKANALPRLQVVLSKDGNTKTIDVHRVIAMTFLENEQGYDTVNHIDGNPFNNSVDNLEWISRKENIRHAFKNNLIHTMKPIAMLNPATKEILKVYPSEAEACRIIGVNQGKIRRSIQNGWKCHGYYWRYFDIKNEPATTIEEWQGNVIQQSREQVFPKRRAILKAHCCNVLFCIDDIVCSIQKYIEV